MAAQYIFLRNHHLTQQLLVSFYRCCIESILTYCMCVWFSSCTAANKKALQRVVTTAQKIISCPLPSLEELYNTRCLRKAQKIIKDSSHPGHSLFELLPSGRRYRTLKTRTNRLKNSFYAKAITTLNTATHTWTDNCAIHGCAILIWAVQYSQMWMLSSCLCPFIDYFIFILYIYIFITYSMYS